MSLPSPVPGASESVANCHGRVLDEVMHIDKGCIASVLFLFLL